MKFSARTQMSKNLISIKSSDPLAVAYEKMQSRSIRHLPVVNDRDELVGIISDRDLSKALNQDVEVEKKVPTIRYTFPKGVSVSSIMHSPVKAVDQSADIKSVIEHMLNNKISSVLVAGRDEVEGIITTDDLLKLLLHLLEEDEDRARWDLEALSEEGWLTSGRAEY